MKTPALPVGRLRFEDLDASYLRTFIDRCREEDLSGLGLKQPFAPRDLTSELLESDRQGCLYLIAREPLKVCGASIVGQIAKSYDEALRFKAHCQDGEMLETQGCLGSLEGSFVSMLKAERVILNFLQKLSGIATLTNTWAKALTSASKNKRVPKLLDTRKTTPGFRVLEKYAVACGGGWNHRFALGERVLIKDNHLIAAEALQGEKLANFLKKVPKSLGLWEVEVDTLAQLEKALEVGAPWILLDNFEVEILKQAVELTRQSDRQSGQHTLLEASGQLSGLLESLANLDLDFVSCGGLIHQARWVDIGLDPSL